MCYCCNPNYNGIENWNSIDIGNLFIKGGIYCIGNLFIKGGIYCIHY